jgi:hypothetical protein
MISINNKLLFFFISFSKHITAVFCVMDETFDSGLLYTPFMQYVYCGVHENGIIGFHFM